MSLNDEPPPYETVVFDCDSTLSALEGIEELARGRLDDAGRRELEVLTNRAMNGEVALEDVYGRRLELVRPNRAAVEEVGDAYVRAALPHAAELVAALHSLHKRVAIVSGGLLPAVLVLARELGIPDDQVHAVGVVFRSDGTYWGFDEHSPLARSGGKIEVVSEIGAAGGALALVGDGATDLEAAPLAARFIAFGGVVRRESVLTRARVRCVSPDLAALVPLLLSPGEIAELSQRPEHLPLLDAATRCA